MSIGSFTLIRNEIAWIRAHLECWLPHLDEMVFFEGGSTDGTWDVLLEYARNHPHGHKLIVSGDRDPNDLKDDYVRLSNEALRSLSTDWAIFLHPDMTAENPECLRDFKWRSGVAASSSMRSFAGEPGGEILEVSEGRAKAWKNIYRLRNPDLGAHYHGWYGAWNEDVYLREITGEDHSFHGERFDRYPYPVIDSGLKILHFSDVRPYSRRLERMVKCLQHQGYGERSLEIAKEHPRVTLKSEKGFTFTPWNQKVAA